MDKETKVTLNYTKEEALSFLCQAMQDETIRLRKARKKERASIRKFLIEAFSVISASNLDTQSITTNLGGEGNEKKTTKINSGSV